MMTASDFKSASNIRFHRRKNPIILDIDKLLSEYWKTVSENRKMKCLVYIYMMCKHYLTTKPNGRRGDAVQELIKQVRAILDSPEFKKQVEAKVGGRHYENGKVTNVMDPGSATATSLQQGYGWEGILPQKNFVEKMGLSLDTLLGPDKYFGASGIGYGIRTKLENQGVQGAEQKALTMLKTLPFSQVLDYLHGMWLDGEMQGSFNYLNAEGRVDYMLVVRAGRLQRHVGGPFETGIIDNKPQPKIYAMDCSERLYALPSDAPGKEGTDWNHSSLLSGHAVVCAGMIRANSGVLKEIDNSSGHYRPDTQNLADCVRALRRAGIDTSSFRVTDKKTGVSYATADLFLAQNP